MCPACGERSVRAYLTVPERARRPTLVSYVWCAGCRRFVGTRAAHPAGVVVSDPLAVLTPAERRELEGSLTGFLAHLDKLWDDGVLDPLVTRDALGLALAACAQAPLEPVSYGVFRM